MKTIRQVKTPKGELQWVTISGEGKENLNGDFQYVASIAFDPEDKAWAALLSEIEDFWEENRPKHIKTPKSMGFYDEMVKTEEVDEDGDLVKAPTGRTVLQFKTGVAWPDGNPKVIKTYNSKAKDVRLGNTKIGNGSIGEIQGAYDIYKVTAPGGGKIINAGVTFYLNAIKINKLVEFSQDSGFTADEDDEDGWTGDEGWEGEAVAETAEAEPAEAKPKPKPKVRRKPRL